MAFPNFDRASTIAKSLIPLAIDPGTIPLLLFPNPFSDVNPLRVQLEGVNANTPVDATLTDLSGRILWQKRYVASGLAAFVVPDPGLSSGVYLLTFVAGDKKRTLKVVKQ